MAARGGGRLRSDAAQLGRPVPLGPPSTALPKTPNHPPTHACSIPGFYNAFKDKLRNLQQGCDTTVWLCLEVRAPLLPSWAVIRQRMLCLPPAAHHLPHVCTNDRGKRTKVVCTPLLDQQPPAFWL